MVTIECYQSFLPMLLISQILLVAGRLVSQRLHLTFFRIKGHSHENLRRPSVNAWPAKNLPASLRNTAPYTSMWSDVVQFCPMWSDVAFCQLSVLLHDNYDLFGDLFGFFL